jgi:hypothetical protein
MVDEALGRDLMSFGTPILVLGDPGQLPPISGGGFFTEHEPDILLTEIHRQARDNPIIDLAMQVREGREIMHGDYGTAGDRQERGGPRHGARGRSGAGRHQPHPAPLQQRLRELKGFTQALPQAGDKLVCLRNDPAKGLLNGSLWQVMTSSKETVKPGINLMSAPRTTTWTAAPQDQAAQERVRGPRSRSALVRPRSATTISTTATRSPSTRRRARSGTRWSCSTKASPSATPRTLALHRDHAGRRTAGDRQVGAGRQCTDPVSQRLSKADQKPSRQHC